MYKIEDGIEIPRQTREGRVSSYPVIDLKPGQSFNVPLKGKKDRNKAASNVRTIVSRIARLNPGRKFVTRTSKDGIRVWRVK